MTDQHGDGDGDGELEGILAAARRVTPALTPSRSQKWRWTLLSRLDGRRRSRAPVVAAVGAAAAALAVLGWQQWRPGSDPIAPPPAQLASNPGLQVLADGSRVVLDGPTTALRKEIESESYVVYELQAGGARFEVVRRPSRTFRVRAGAVTLQVIGTRFLVQRLEDRSRVSVTEGRVLVSWWGGSRELGAGEDGTFPPEPVAVRAAPAAASIATRRHAPDSRPNVLFAQADRAREAGKPELAVAHLRTVLDRFPSDPHAQMAAFTIGRLLLEVLHEPRQAAASFEQARVLAKGERLAEDALAREVDAWAAAGEPARARRHAELYRRLYPNGSRLHAVLRVGGLEQSAP